MHAVCHQSVVAGLEIEVQVKLLNNVKTVLVFFSLELSPCLFIFCLLSFYLKIKRVFVIFFRESCLPIIFNNTSDLDKESEQIGVEGSLGRIRLGISN